MKRKLLIILIFSISLCFQTYAYEATEDNKYMLNFLLNQNIKAVVDANIENFYNDFIIGKIEKTDNDWRYKREIVILKYLCEGSQFEYKLWEVDLSQIPEVSTAYGALINKKAVCQGYAHAFAMLCDKCEIECYILEGPDHMWNAVRLDDGNLYHVDTAYVISEGKNDYYSNCNLNDEESKKLGYAHSVWYPEIVATGGIYNHLMYQ